MADAVKGRDVAVRATPRRLFALTQHRLMSGLVVHAQRRRPPHTVLAPGMSKRSIGTRGAFEQQVNPSRRARSMAARTPCSNSSQVSSSRGPHRLPPRLKEERWSAGRVRSRRWCAAPRGCISGDASVKSRSSKIRRAVLDLPVLEEPAMTSKRGVRVAVARIVASARPTRSTMPLLRACDTS